MGALFFRFCGFPNRGRGHFATFYECHVVLIQLWASCFPPFYFLTRVWHPPRGGSRVACLKYSIIDNFSKSLSSWEQTKDDDRTDFKRRAGLRSVQVENSRETRLKLTRHHTMITVRNSFLNWANFVFKTTEEDSVTFHSQQGKQAKKCNEIRKSS